MRKLLLVFFLPIAVVATTFSGTGFGTSHPNAKKEALSDLSSSIKSEVYSEFKSKSSREGSTKAVRNLRVTSSLPIIGVTYAIDDIVGGYSATCILDASKAKGLYADKLKRLTDEISILTKKLETTDTSKKYYIYEELLGLLNNYERYRSVAVVLDIKKIPEPLLTVSEVHLKLQALSSKADSLSLAATILSKGIKQKSIYIYPPKADRSNEITPFAKAVKDALKTQLNTVTTINKADFILRGNYRTEGDGISLSVELIDKKQNVVHASVVRLLAKAYRDYESIPKTIDFDALLQDGLIVKSKLKARIKTEVGDEDLLFMKGQTIKLFVKLNRSGYYYIVGHVNQKDKKFSYLLDLNEDEGNNKFMQYVDGDDANKWMSLGEFEVEAPYGIESIQLIASNKKFTKLPAYYYDKESEYYLLGKDPMKVIMATRGLKRKKNKTAQTAEAVMMFTTMEK